MKTSNKDKIIKFAQTKGRMPSKYKEPKLYSSYNVYTSPSSPVFDFEFTMQMCKLGKEIYTTYNPKIAKQEVIDFVRKNGRLPSSTKKEEKRLFKNYSNYSSYKLKDEKFYKTVKSLVRK